MLPFFRVFLVGKWLNNEIYGEMAEFYCSGIQCGRLSV